MRLNDWLDHCARHGLDVGLRERLLAHGLVQRLKLQNTWPATASERLRCLGPLLCHNPQQQTDYAQLVLLQARAPAMAAAAVGALGDAAQARSDHGRPRRLAQALLLLALLTTALLLLGPRFNPQPALKGPATPASAAVTPASGGLQIDPGSTRLGAAAAGPTGGPDAPVYMSPRHIPALQPQGPAWVAPIRWAMAVLAALSAAFTSWRLWRWQRRRLYAQADAVPEDQLVQTVLRDPQAQPLTPRTRVLAPLSRLLRQRVVSDGQQLAGRATVQASIRQGGLLALRFAPRSRLPEYLALIERNGEQDHQSRYHEAMVSALQQRGVPVEVFFYRHNPGDACWRLRAATPAAARPAGLVEGERTPHDRQGLAALMARYPRHRLLVLGDAAAAVHPHTGQPADWTRLVRPMGQRAWFTPLPLPDWGSVEAWVTSAQGLDFLLLPMEEAALHTWADWLASGRAHLQQDPRAPACYPPLLRESADAWAVRTVAPPTAVLQRLLQELRSYLGPQGMQWLAACAIFPLLSWPLTLALGRRLLQAQAKTHAAAVPDDSGLALGAGALGALPWFRHGRLPDWLRAPLLAELPPDTAQLLRDELQTRLARAASGQGEAIASVARLKGLLRRGRGALVDVLLLRFIEPALASPLAQALPETLRRWLFPQGSALLGLRSRVAWLAAAPMLLALLWLPPVWHAVAPADQLPVLRAVPESGHGALAVFSLAPDGRTVGSVSSDRPTLVEFSDAQGRATVLPAVRVSELAGAPVRMAIGPTSELTVCCRLNRAARQGAGSCPNKA